MDIICKKNLSDTNAKWYSSREDFILILKEFNNETVCMWVCGEKCEWISTNHDSEKKL